MAATVAQVADVKRLLNIPSTDTSSDDYLAKALEAALDVVANWLRRDYRTVDTNQTKTYYDVKEDGTIPMPFPGAQITTVRFFRTPSATAYTGVVTTDYEIEDGGRTIRLHPTFFDVPFEGAVSAHLPDNWSRIEVDYTPSTAVPSAVRDGVALTAAAIFKRSPIAAGGLTSENLGDYSYTMKPMRGATGVGDSETIPDMAKAMLRPYKLRRGLAD